MVSQAGGKAAAHPAPKATATATAGARILHAAQKSQFGVTTTVTK
jgi:hypothetical protein